LKNECDNSLMTQRCTGIMCMKEQIDADKMEIRLKEAIAPRCPRRVQGSDPLGMLAHATAEAVADTL